MISAVTGAPYWIDLKHGFRDKAEELGVEANFTGPPTVDVNAQIDEINRAIAQKVDGIIMVAMADSVTPAIDQAITGRHTGGVRRCRRPFQQALSFIGTGNYNAGYQGGEELARLLLGAVKSPC